MIVYEDIGFPQRMMEVAIERQYIRIEIASLWAFLCHPRNQTAELTGDGQIFSLGEISCTFQVQARNTREDGFSSLETV